MIKKNYSFLVFLLLLCSLNTLIVALNLDGLKNNYALGKHTISLFIQLPYLTFVYILLLNFFKIDKNKSFIYSILSIIPSLLLLSKYFFNELVFFEEDNFRYDKLAKYYLENKTFVADSAFTIQPGYTYYLTIILLFFEEQTRLTQILNILVCFLFLRFFINFISFYKFEKFEKYFVYYLIFGSTFFLSKNIIFCISEWLYICLILLLPILITNKKFRLTAIFLGFAVLIRTNYFLILSLLSLTIFYFNKNKLNLLIYFLITLIPLSHNLIFHDEYAFFITNEYVDIAFHYAIFDNLKSFIVYTSNHLLSYFALSKVYINNNWTSTSFLISIVSLPFFSFYFIFKFFKMNITDKLSFLVIILTTLGVTYVFGWAYYPRFQITNYLTVFIMLICLNILKDKYKLSFLDKI